MRDVGFIWLPYTRLVCMCRKPMQENLIPNAHWSQCSTETILAALFRRGMQYLPQTFN